LYHGVTLGGTSWKKGKRHPTLHNDVVIGAGAKVLGPIEIGTGARVGSNSVVLKSVPAGATAVGIPAHLVDSKKKPAALERDQLASKMGFDAYGSIVDMPDPIAHAINHILDHINQMDKQVECLRQALKEAGIDCKTQGIPELTDCAIDDGE
jgi:serine O-acetyltransferase